MDQNLTIFASDLVLVTPEPFISQDFRLRPSACLPLNGNPLQRFPKANPLIRMPKGVSPYRASPRGIPFIGIRKEKSSCKDPQRGSTL